MGIDSISSNCYDDNMTYCDEFDSCYNLGTLQPIDKPKKNQGNTANTIKQDEEHEHLTNNLKEPPIDELKVTCSKENISSKEGEQNCMNMCKISSCCIQPLGSIESCLRDNVPVCE